MGDDNSHVEQAAAPPQRQMDPVLVPDKKHPETGGIRESESWVTNYPCVSERAYKIPTPGSPLFSDTSCPRQVDTLALEMYHNNNPFRYPPNAPPGISHDYSTLMDTIDPKCLDISNFDSGCSDLGGLSSQQDTEICRHQYSQVRGEASTGGGGARQVTSGNTEVRLHKCSEVRNQTSTGGGAGWVTSGNEAPEQDLSIKLLERLNSVIEALRECKGHQTTRLCIQNIALQMPEDFLQVFAETYQKEYNPSHRAKGKGEERE